MSAAKSIDALSNQLFNKISSKLGLKRTDYTDVYDMSEWNRVCSNGEKYSGSSGWYDEATGSKLTGVSKYSLIGDYICEHSIEVWLGPGLLVPNMFLTIGYDVKNGAHMLKLKSDYHPRGPYALGSDQRYLDLYYSNDIVNRKEYPNTLPPSSSFYGRLLHSPSGLGLTALLEDELEGIATAHVDQWLSWMDEAQSVETRQRALINSRDDKLRQLSFRAKFEELSPIFGNEYGKQLAAAFTGPVAEAYVGGGS